MKKLTLFALTLAVLAAPSAEAREFEITPFVGYQFGGSVDVTYQGSRESVSINDAGNYGLMLNLGISDAMQLELLYNTQGTSVDARSVGDTLDLDIDYLMFSVLWDFNPYDDDFSPYMVFGIGGSWMKPEDFSSVSRFSGNIGGGVKYFFSDRIGVRAEGRLYGTYINTEVAWCDPLWCYGTPNNLWQLDLAVGLIIRLGSY